ncbi:ice-binding family protein [Geopsychrobacter electrodiphilus]|uniref:ice-binding family protein n=1 Tax=Geopsychrobacter electrodiphilus TaxID=225196 RepID=UPI000360DD43|nr:ice-binding family protein [Geopsychrobacter electrodiphilus]
MKRFIERKAYLLSMLVLSVFVCTLPAYAGSHHRSSDDNDQNSTSSTSAAGPKAVNLGTAGDFVILTKTGITTTGTTAIVGNMGVSPIVATAMTGFGLIADSTNTFSTSALVTGKIYAADYAPPTPTIMTTAIGDMQTAYTDAAGRINPDFAELGGGDISGKTLLPGLYNWSTDVLITNAGITLAGGPNDIWILQMAGNLTVNNSAMVTLLGGAQAKNIFWQVSGQATLGTAADMKGIILSKTLISMNTGAKLSGRALAQTAVTLIANTVTAP